MRNDRVKSVNQMFCLVVLQWNRDPCCVVVLFTRLCGQSYWQHCHWNYSCVHHRLDVIITFFIIVFTHNRLIDYFRITTVNVELNRISLQTASLYIRICTAANAGVHMDRALLFCIALCDAFALEFEASALLDLWPKICFLFVYLWCVKHTIWCRQYQSTYHRLVAIDQLMKDKLVHISSYHLCAGGVHVFVHCVGQWIFASK